jgi:hypothetical protein
LLDRNSPLASTSCGLGGAVLARGGPILIKATQLHFRKFAVVTSWARPRRRYWRCGRQVHWTVLAWLFERQTEASATHETRQHGGEVLLLKFGSTYSSSNVPAHLSRLVRKVLRLNKTFAVAIPAEINMQHLGT